MHLKLTKSAGKKSLREKLYFVHHTALHFFLLFKQLDSVLEPFLEKQQVGCVGFQSGLAGFPLGLRIHLQRPQ